MRHVVVDTNCLLRMIPLRSKYRSVWEAFLNEEYIICVSNDILSEYLEILTQKVSHVFAIRIVNALLKSNCIKLYDPHFHFGLIVQDPDDNKFVDCAIVADADYRLCRGREAGTQGYRGWVTGREAASGNRSPIPKQLYAYTQTIVRGYAN